MASFYSNFWSIGLFVDVGENMSVLDRINLTFVYDEIGHKGQSAEEEENAVSFPKNATTKQFEIKTLSVLLSPPH